MTFAIKVDANMHNVDIDGDTPPLWVLRGVLGMTGTKFGCGMGAVRRLHRAYRRRPRKFLHHPDRQRWQFQQLEGLQAKCAIFGKCAWCDLGFIGEFHSGCNRRHRS